MLTQYRFVKFLTLGAAYIYTNTIFLDYLTLESDCILQKLILNNKYICVEFYCQLDSYKKIDILKYAKEISIDCKMISENIVDVISQSVNLQDLTIYSSHISSIDVKKIISEKQFLKYIHITLTKDVNLHDIYTMIEIKSLDALYLSEHINGNYLNYEKIFKILYYIVNNLNKNITIVMDCHGKDDELRKFTNPIMYNFKMNYYCYYIFTYITCAYRKFDNLYDFDLYYL